jgi:hypothetical protein
MSTPEKPRNLGPEDVAQLTGSLLEFVNETSASVGTQKAALLTVLESGLVQNNTDLIEVDGEILPFAQQLGRLEGQETVLNAIAAFTMARAQDESGNLEPDSLQ